MVKKAALLFLVLMLLPSVVFAGKAYYIDCSAGGNGNGTYASPWNNISSVNSHNFKTGDDVYFKVNTTCTPITELNIDWDGSSSDRVTIGAYYGNGRFGLNGNSRPIIDGNNHTVPGQYRALVIMSQQGLNGHVTIKDLHIKDSGYHGIATNYVDDVNIDNCYVSHSAVNGILLARCVGGNITNNTVDHAGYDTTKGTTSNAGLSISGMGIMGQTDSVVISGNTIFNCWREGIDIIKGATNCLVENNIVYDNYNVGIYLSNTNSATVRHNIVYRSLGNQQWSGIEIQNEAYTWRGSGGDDHKIYGNLIAGVRWGIKLVPIEGSLTDAKIYNNTIVDCDYSFGIANFHAGWSGNEIKNNISWTITAGTRHSNSYSPIGVTWSHNNFDDSVSGYAATNARIYNPELIKTSGWRSIRPGTAIGTEWSLQENSSNINNGTSINGYNGRIYDCNYADDPITVRIKIDSTPDIGAWMYGENVREIDPPKSVILKFQQ